MRVDEAEDTQRTSPGSYGFEQRITPPSRSPRLRLLRLTALWEAFLVATSSLRTNKLRTSLTLMGIIVGVTAVIAVVTIIKAGQTVAQLFRLRDPPSSQVPKPQSAIARRVY